MALRAVLAAGALLAVPGVYAGNAAQFQVSYAEYFSGIGSIYNQTTQQIIQESIQEQFTTANPSNVVLTPVDFPVDSAFVFPGITLATWNSIPHTQDTFQSGLAGDLGISASQVTIGDFKQQTNPNGLYVPFTVSGLGGTNAQALNVAQNIYNNEPGTTSGLAKALSSIGIHPVTIVIAPNPWAPAWATYPSVGVITNITLTLPNITATEAVVAGNPNDLFTLGYLVQDLAANGVNLGPVEGGLYVVVGSLQVTTPAGVTLSPSAPLEYIASPPPPSAPGTQPAAKPTPAAATPKSSAQRAVVAISALAIAVLAAIF